MIGMAVFEALCAIRGVVEPGEAEIVSYHDAGSWEIWEPLFKALEDGTWYATGDPSPGVDSKPAKIAAHHWRLLRLDVDRDMASDDGGRLVLYGLRFFKRPAKGIKGEAECTEWLIEKMKEPKRSTKPEVRAEAIERFHVSATGFDERIWPAAKKSPTRHKSWDSSGPPNRSSVSS
jgi:hypothetical protein